jgi:hypothetical protein
MKYENGKPLPPPLLTRLLSLLNPTFWIRKLWSGVTFVGLLFRTLMDPSAEQAYRSGASKTSTGRTLGYSGSSAYRGDSARPNKQMGRIAPPCNTGG